MEHKPSLSSNLHGIINQSANVKQLDTQKKKPQTPNIEVA